jgi:hypothetical protein
MSFHEEQQFLVNLEELFTRLRQEQLGRGLEAMWVVLFADAASE